MPWDSKSFQKKSKNLTPQQATKGARVANAVLETTGDEGLAIAVGIKQAKNKKSEPKKK